MEIPQFHLKKITTQITMRSGSYQLIGNWRPTGDPKYAEHDLMQIAFILAQVVPTYDVKALKPEE